jgi:hypothetical protein
MMAIMVTLLVFEKIKLGEARLNIAEKVGLYHIKITQRTLLKLEVYFGEPFPPLFQLTFSSDW